MTRTGQAAIDYANGCIGENVMPAGYCLQFTRECFAVPALYGSAIDAWNATSWPHPGDRNPPPAVPVWFATPSVYDHVCIRTEDAYVVSTVNDDVRRFTDISDIERVFDAEFLGWSEDINSVRVYQHQQEEEDMTPEQAQQLERVLQVSEVLDDYINDPAGRGHRADDHTLGWIRDHARTLTDGTKAYLMDQADGEQLRTDIVGAIDATTRDTGQRSDDLVVFAIVVLIAVVGGVALGLLVDTREGVVAGIAALVGGLLAVVLRTLSRGRPA